MHLYCSPSFSTNVATDGMAVTSVWLLRERAVEVHTMLQVYLTLETNLPGLSNQRNLVCRLEIQTHLHTHSHTYTHTHSHTLSYTHSLTHTHTHCHTNIHILTHTHTHSHTHSHTLNHTHSDIHLHTHIHTSLSPFLCDHVLRYFTLALMASYHKESQF